MGSGEISIKFIEIFSCCDFFWHLGGIYLFIVFSLLFVDRSSFDFPSQLASQKPPKSTKIVKKSMPRCLPMLRSLFHRFLMDFCSNFGPPESKIINILLENKCFLGFRPFQLNLTTLRFRCPICLHFGAKLAPKN